MEIYFLNKFLYFLTSLNKTLKKDWQMERKYWESQGNLSVQKAGNHGDHGTSFLFLFFFSDFLMELYFLNKFLYLLIH